MKIIVLGASGQIGSAICDALRDRYDVIGTSRKSSSGYFHFDPFHDDWSLLGTVDVLINCIGQIEVSGKNSFHHIHVDLTNCIIQNRERIGNPRIIQISALGASSNHQVDFLRTKGIADTILFQHANTIIVRPSIVCTHHTMLVRKMLMLFRISRYTAGILPMPKELLKTQIQPVMPQDLTDIVAALCLNTGTQKIVNVVGPERLSFHEILDIMFEARNKKYHVTKITKTLCDLLIKRGVSVVFPSVINWQQYQLLFDNNVADIETVCQILGRLPSSTKQFFQNEFSYATH